MSEIPVRRCDRCGVWSTEVAIVHKEILCSACFDALKKTEKKTQGSPHKIEEEPSGNPSSTRPGQE